MSRVFTCFLFGLLTLSYGAKADEANPLDKIYACADVVDDMERLACFDASVLRVKTDEEQGSFATITRNDADEMQTEAFGFSFPKLSGFNPFKRSTEELSDSAVETSESTLTEAAKQPETKAKKAVERNEEGRIVKLSFEIKTIKKGGDNKLMIVFENGQVWQQSSSKNIRISRNSPPTSAEISTGSLGSYFIKLEGSGSRFKAKRLR